ncbi:MAG: EscU/YscU/HrcU family type III secretion system export apparatus switch protein [Alphaproteobacteria bacterium]|nr:EscU/YscU/HrcU family type III secretion system export apparatus switch protein [Alphaproteobacteria bacterium]
MAEGESESGEKTLDASEQRLKQARQDGDVAVSREGAVAGVYFGTLLAVMLTAGPALRQIGEILLPLLDQPEAYIDGTPQGLQAAFGAAMKALGIALAPVFGLMVAGAFLPYLFQNALVISTKRIAPKLSHVSPRGGIKRILGQRALVEFLKSLAKMAAIAGTCWLVARPIYANSVGLVMADIGVLPEMMRNAVLAILGVVTIVATIIAGIDVPYQHWSYRRRLRMSFHEMREELRSTDGDPHTKLRQRKIRHQRLRNRMLLEVPEATVIVTNPTHFAVALRYERGKDPAPVVVAKGADLMAQKIREIAFAHQVAIVENVSLARALYASVEIGSVIPQEYFEVAAKIISVVWSRAGRQEPASEAP